MESRFLRQAGGKQRVLGILSLEIFPGRPGKGEGAGVRGSQNMRFGHFQEILPENTR